MSNAEELFEAIRNGDSATVVRLLEADPLIAKERNPDGATAIMLAKYHGQNEIAKELLRAPIVLDVFEACALGLKDRTRGLLEQKPSIVHMRYEDGFTLLGLAAFFGHLAILNMLLELGADPNLASSNKMKVRPIHSAVAHRNPDVALEMVRVLIENGAKTNAAQHGGWTPLHQAAAHGLTEIVELLLEAGADPTVVSDDGKTALEMARAGGHEEAAAPLESVVVANADAGESETEETEETEPSDEQLEDSAVDESAMSDEPALRAESDGSEDSDKTG
ncbi:MAG: ankyrin repeat domain-containing protein [Gammaproteobacteria bacterium]